MKSGYRSCGLAAASSSALGISRRKITHTSTSIWAMPVRSSAPIALRYSFSIRAWVHTKLIRQIVLTVTWTELKSRNQRQAPSSCSLGAVHMATNDPSSAGRIRHDGRTNDSGCAQRLVTVGRHFAVFPRGSTRRRALQHAARAQTARHDAFAPSLDDPCTAFCVIDRAPKPRAADGKLSEVS